MAQGHMEEIKCVKGVMVLRITGFFTKETTPDFQEVCYRVSEREGVHAILLDFKDVETTDTSAFACMVGFIKDHIGQQVKIGIINLEKDEKALLEILHISDMIHIFKNETGAITALTRKRNSGRKNRKG